MTLINTRVRVVLDVTESNEYFPLIIITIREPYIIAKVAGRGEYNSVILYCYYYAMSERIKALGPAIHIYVYLQCVCIHVLIKNIFHVVLKVLSANDLYLPPRLLLSQPVSSARHTVTRHPASPPWSLAQAKSCQLSMRLINRRL